MSDLKEMIEKYSSQARLATANDSVYKDECVYCYATPFSPDGLYVCLNRFIGVSKDLLPVYYSKTQSHLYLKIKSTRKEIPIEEDENSGEPEKKKPSKFGIGIDGGFAADQVNYFIEHEYFLYIHPEDREVKLNETTFQHECLTDQVLKSIQSVVKAESNALKEELASLTTAWDGEQRFVSKHSANLLQLPNPIQISPNPADWKCSMCDINKNLWMNLTDGTILCGRKQLDGSGGNNHAVDYYERTKYPLAVKLGTINAKGADVFSYDEDDMVEDSNLAVHLAHFGINMSKMEKSDKTMAEMEIDLNQKVGEWDRIQESGSKLVPLYGTGYTGMQNLGNSCYMNSVMQVIFTIPEFAQKYASELNRSEYLQRAPVDPTNDFNFQMSKLASGLLSGQYSVKPFITDKINVPKGIKPNSFKNLMGRGHSEFSTKRQQDAHEYLTHLVSLCEHNARTDLVKTATNPIESFKFQLEDRIECAQSKHVKYTHRDEFCLPLPISKELALNKDKVQEYESRKAAVTAEGKKLEPGDIVRPEISMKDCLNLFIQNEHIDDFYSTATRSKGIAYKSTSFSTFPDFLFIQARKFELGPDWAPIKLDISLQVPDYLDLSEYRGTGKKDSEVELVEEAEPIVPEFHLNENVISQLMDMGFSADAAKRAAYHTRNNNDPEAAVNWCMAHMEDSDFNSPFEMPNMGPKTTPKAQLSEEGIMMLQSMGFNRAQAMKALEATNNNIERAADWIFSHTDEIMNLDENTPTQSNEATAETKYRDGSGNYKLVAFISHMGTNASVGHYVAHILKDDKWCIFNDENVAQSENPPRDLAYLYLYKRV